MGNRIVRTIAWALALGAGVAGTAVAQSLSPASDGEMAPLTMLTMASDGSWGTASAPTSGAAVAAAVADCRRRSHQTGPGCGAASAAVRGGWSLGIRCGSENIVVAAKTLVEAEQAALNRELDLRQRYLPDMPPCVRVVTIDPSGAVAAPDAAAVLRVVMRRYGNPAH